MSYLTTRQYMIEVNRGNVPNTSIIDKFGRNLSVGTTFSLLTLGGIWRTPQAAAATSLRIAAGGDANDTAAGSGAREVTLYGLDETWAEVSEAIATAGASASSGTTTTFTRLNRIRVTASGSYADPNTPTYSHAAPITIENAAGGTTWGIVDATSIAKSTSDIGCYAVPDGYSVIINMLAASVDSTKLTDFLIMARENANETAAPYTAAREIRTIQGVNSAFIREYSEDGGLGPFVGPCDIWPLAKVSASTSAVEIALQMIQFPTPA